MTKKSIAVVGAVNIDICGTSEEQLILYDSNPANTVISYGGVGRNIAENLSRLGFEVYMVTALSDDIFSQKLVSYSESVGINFDHSMNIPGSPCSTYLSINNNNGDLILGVSDMKIYDLMTVDFIATQIDFLNTCDIVIVDTNIPQNIIEYIAEHCTAPLAVDPVSTKKSLKLINCVGKFTMIKPNIYEAEILSNTHIESDTALEDAANYFHRLGVKYVFLSMAEEGVYYSDGVHKGTVPICTEYEVVNVSGCGDALFSGATWAFTAGFSTKDIAIAGMCAANICAHSNKTVTEDLTVEHIQALMTKYNK